MRDRRTATLRPRRSRTQIPPQTRGMSQSATPATQNDMSTSSDTYTKTRESHVCATFPIGTATLRPRRSRTQIPPQTRGMSQSAMPATQNDMSTSSDTYTKTRESHVCATFPIGTATLRPRWSRTQIPPQTRGMSQSATPATQNDMTTASDTSKKSRESHVCATFPIGTATLRPRRPRANMRKRLQMVSNGRGRLQTVADGCGRKKAGSREQGSTPRPPNVKREPFATHSGKSNFDLLQTKHFNRLFCAQPVCVYIYILYIYIYIGGGP